MEGHIGLLLAAASERRPKGGREEVAEDLEAREGAPGGTEEIRSIAVFDVGGRRCALPTAAVQEVLLLPELARPPGLPPVLEGVMNLGGVAVPVLRLDRLMDLPEQSLDLYSPIILLRGLAAPVALLGERMREVRSLEPGALAPVGGDEVGDETFRACILGLVGEGEEAIHLLDPARILLAEEQARLVAFQAEAQRRLADWREGAR